MYPRSDDTSVWDRGTTPRQVRFKYLCEGLVDMVRSAARPGYERVDPHAVLLAKFAVREAKKLGLYKEPLDVNVLVQLDVCAGEELPQ